MKRDEPYSPNLKSSALPNGLFFRKSKSIDVNEIASLMLERNPQEDLGVLKDRTEREIQLT